MTQNRKRWLTTVLVLVVAAGGYFAWQKLGRDNLPAGIASGNGRIEAVEIDIAAKTPGRIQDIVVREGDFVTTGQVLARMDTTQLEAQLRQAKAQLRRAGIGVDTAKSVVSQREAEKKTAIAVIAQRNAELDTANRKFERSTRLIRTNAVPQQVLDDDRAAAEGAKAAVAAAEAQRAASEAALSSAQAQVVDAEAAVDSAKASIDSIEADINEGTLRAPRDGRVQFRVAQPGEILAAGGRVLNMVDLGDVYMTFFLPTAQAGRVAIGADVRIILDAAPQWVIPAKASFVANVAQFTPKTVETEEERQRLMFRVRAHISPDLLQRHIEQVKTGLPGRAFVRIDSNVDWPPFLTEKLVK
ncbi:HlyD family secretion protein [Bradyrhizobium cenepequi]|uniref:HlyD family secretion protein n=1 Tax=Bradyrhizobium cenepequi TaxID=2821403 RepID=UPI001CE33E52|nr:HlyD family efflux transporter periplasmic adaptor subunit [Bradyrhizobium cenepequi]MCA6110326.1 HlyD family efflux transporter periplasmic adaptor subunit [Bradyrhizobium cenepequi]